MLSLRAPQREREKKRPDLRVVDEKTEPARRTGAGVVGTLFIVLLFACIFGVVVFQVFLVQTQSRLDQLDQQVSTADAQTKDLRLETTNLEAPDRIVHDARDRLGMIAPNDIVYLQQKPDDDTRAQFDPTKEKPPAPPTTVAATATTPTWSAPPASVPTGAAKPGTTPTTVKAGTTPTTKPGTTPTTTPTTPTTPTTTKPTTTPTTAPKKR